MQLKTCRSIAAGTILALSLAVLGCAPEVGSDAWCKKLKETPKGDWTANDAGSYAKHCLMD